MARTIEQRTLFVTDGLTFSTREQALTHLAPGLPAFIRAYARAYEHESTSYKIRLIRTVRDSIPGEPLGLREAKEYVEACLDGAID